MSSLFDQVLGPMEIALNRYLSGNEDILQRWAGTRGGLSIEFRDLAWSFSMLPGAQGFQIMPGRVEPKAILSTSLVGMARLLAGEDPREMGDAARLEGDVEFAAELFENLRKAEFDLEGELSRLIGPMLGQKIGQGMREFFGLGRQAVSGVLGGATQNLLKSENPDLVSTPEADQWMDAVDDTASAIDRLEARLARLEQSRAEPPAE